MTKLRDLTGQVFGYWTVVERGENSPAGQTRWLCRCRCGTTALVQAASLVHGHGRSCGCLKVEKTRQRSTKHSHAHEGKLSPTYHSWAGMKARCTNPNHSSFERYGGAGVLLCERWLSFENFLADMGERPPGTTLDRYPNQNGNYEPGNCRWATDEQQARNKGNNRLLTLDGVTRTTAEWSEVLGLPQATISDRLRRGRSDAEALSLTKLS
jgi:hypothetical protein